MQNRLKKRILLLRLDAIGDFVLFTSVLPHLRKVFKHGHITLMVNSVVLPLAEHCPYVDGIMGIDPKRYTTDRKFVEEIAHEVQGKFDIAINAQYSRTWQTDNIIARTHAPIKIGFECLDKDGQQERRTREQVLYTHLIRTTSEWMYELDRYVGLLQDLGISINGRILKPELWITDQDRESCNQFLKNVVSPHERFAVLCPGAGFDIKLWSAASFVSVADQLYGRYQMKVIIAGTENEKLLATSIMESMKHKAIDAMGILTLPQFVALMEKAAFYIGIDTAGFHIAWTLGKPTVGIFGGGHFGRFTPTLPHVKIVHVPMDCYYCYWHCIYDEAKCITTITPEMVMQEIERVVQTREKVVVH